MATDNLMPQSSTSIIKHFMLRSSTTGQGLTGKVAADFSGKYNIAGGVEVTLSFSSGTAGDAYSSGKIVPLGLGKYAWHVPNALFASLGNVSAVLSVTGGIDVHFEWIVEAANRSSAAFGANTTAPANSDIAAAKTAAQAVQAKLPNTTHLAGAATDEGYAVLDTATLALINNIPTNSELATALSAADDAVLAAISALNNLSAAQVNAELLDVLSVDTFAELSSPPSATSSLKDKLVYLFMWARNKATQTVTERKLYADDGTTVISTEAVSDTGGTFTKGEAS